MACNVCESKNVQQVCIFPGMFVSYYECKCKECKHEWEERRRE